jgi:hypothetical protein
MASEKELEQKWKGEEDDEYEHLEVEELLGLNKLQIQQVPDNWCLIVVVKELVIDLHHVISQQLLGHHNLFIVHSLDVPHLAQVRHAVEVY